MLQQKILKCKAVVLFGLFFSGCSVLETHNADQNSQNIDSVKEAAPLFHSDFNFKDSVSSWIMEGPGELKFNDGWMEIYSPSEQMHHVFWCPETFPESFIAEWQVQNLNTDAGLLIVFFSAIGANGEDIFESSLSPRDGQFKQYTEGEIKSYHISYYANAVHNPNRKHANLRKNNTFSLLQEGAEGIPAASTDVHDIRLVKNGSHIQLYVDNRKVIDYVDDTPMVDGVDTGPSLGSGKFGFRQMKWSHFRYRNFRVFSIDN